MAKQTKNHADKKAKALANKAPSKTDVLGSYTGRPEQLAQPEQDADDL